MNEWERYVINFTRKTVKKNQTKEKNLKNIYVWNCILSEYVFFKFYCNFGKTTENSKIYLSIVPSISPEYPNPKSCWMKLWTSKFTRKSVYGIENKNHHCNKDLTLVRFTHNPIKSMTKYILKVTRQLLCGLKKNIYFQNKALNWALLGWLIVIDCVRLEIIHFSSN